MCGYVYSYGLSLVSHSLVTRVLLLQHHPYAVFDEATGKMLEYRHLMNHPDPEIRKVWQRLSANEYGRTMQGVGKARQKGDEIAGTDTMHLIKKWKKKR
jgi:hypothetical protein